VLTVVVQFVTPIFLVRILVPKQYGQYQEFIVYSMLAVSFIEFSVNSNLTYFISRNPQKERQYVSNTTLLNVVFSVVGVAILLAAKGLLLDLATFDFIDLMALYILTYVNFNYLEYYWIAKHLATNILYYSFAMAVARTAVVLAVAYFTNNIVYVIYGIVAFQAAKCLFVALYFMSRRLLSIKIDLGVLRSQLHFIVPLGVASVMLYFNNDISKVIISSQLGPVALAMYAIGSKQIPITGIIRASVSDVIFPQIVKSNVTDPKEGLRLWKRANVAYTFLMLPIFFVLFLYANVIIITLFTVEYSQAIPIFRIYLLLLLVRDTIEMGSPLRALNQNKFFVYGNVLSLAVNIAFLYVLFKLFGFYGPAIALVITTATLQVFLGTRIVKAYEIGMDELFMWRKHFMIMGTGLLCSPVLLLGRLLEMNPLVELVVFGGIYTVLYLTVLRRFGIDEVDRIMSRVLGKIGLSWKTVDTAK
jgi:O-antigen/teichoic acid export membrane protein